MGRAIDTAIVVFLLFHIYLGWRRGLMWQIAGIISVVLANYLAYRFSGSLEKYAQEYIVSHPFRARMVAFFFIMGVVALAIRMMTSFYEVYRDAGLTPQESERRKTGDRIFGGVLGAVKGVIAALVLVTTFVTVYPDSPSLRGSLLAKPMANAGIKMLPQGAEDQIKTFVAHSTVELRKNLDIQ